MPTPKIIKADCVVCEICNRVLAVSEERFFVLNGSISTGLSRVSFGHNNIQNNNITNSSVICFRCIEEHFMYERMLKRTILNPKS